MSKKLSNKNRNIAWTMSELKFDKNDRIPFKKNNYRAKQNRNFIRDTAIIFVSFRTVLTP